MEYAYLDASIDEVVRDLAEIFAQRLCLVSNLDSELASFSRLTHAFPGEVVRVGSYGLLEGSLAARPDFYDGFDELSLYDPGSFNIGSLERIWSAHYTTDRVQFSSPPPDEFVAAFHESGAVCYLGDGLGLNVATRDKELMRLIRSHFKDGFGSPQSLR